MSTTAETETDPIDLEKANGDKLQKLNCQSPPEKFNDWYFRVKGCQHEAGNTETEHLW
jgi:hypothetical protein